MDVDSTFEHTLRVVLLPITPMEGDKTEAKQFRTLFSHYSIPSAVPAKRSYAERWIRFRDVQGQG